MKVTREKTENSQVFLTIETEVIEMEEAKAEAFNHLSQKANIPGFRKGKIPREILERYLTKETILSETVEHLVPDLYEKAIKQENINPYAQPEIDITQTEPVVIFKATVPLFPQVTLGDYRKICVLPENIKVTEESIDGAMEQLQHQHATWETTDQAVEFSNLVTVDVESTIEGKPFINRKGIQYHVIRDRPYPMTGFAEQLPGMKRDEEKEFTLKAPTDYGQKDLAGKEVYFKLK